MTTDNTPSLQRIFDLIKTYKHVQVFFELSKGTCFSFVVPSSSVVLKNKPDGSQKLIAQDKMNTIIMDDKVAISSVVRSSRSLSISVVVEGKALELLLF